MTNASAAGSAPTPVELVHVTKSFGATSVLRGVELSVARGEICVVIGASGSGKTTLLKIMGGLDKPSSGEVRIAGVDIVPLGERRLNRVRQSIGMVFQYSALLDWMSVFDNVAFPLREHSSAGAAEVREKVLGKLELLGLSGASDKLPGELSGGMRKRVALARALILEPEVVMYDEPTSGLDPLMARTVERLIVETRDRFGVTSIVISHDMAATVRIADHVHLLANGAIVASGSPRELTAGESEQALEFFEASGVDTSRLLAERDAAP